MSIKLSWSDIEDYIGATLKELKHDPELILGIAQGGIIPGILMSRRLRCKFDVVSVFDSPNELFSRLIGSNRILFVDDINDSGDTMSTIMDMMKYQSHFNWGVAALIRRRSSIYHYGAYGVQVDHDEWFDFPWEQYDKSIDLDKYVEL